MKIVAALALVLASSMAFARGNCGHGGNTGHAGHGPATAQVGTTGICLPLFGACK